MLNWKAVPKLTVVITVPPRLSVIEGNVYGSVVPAYMIKFCNGREKVGAILAPLIVGAITFKVKVNGVNYILSTYAFTLIL